jgi:hypothetical protein
MLKLFCHAGQETAWSGRSSLGSLASVGRAVRLKTSTLALLPQAWAMGHSRGHRIRRAHA